MYHRYNRFISLLLSLLWCTACQVATNTPTPLSPTGQADRTVLTLAVESNLSRYHPLLELFGQEHPEIEVRLVGTDELVAASGSEKDTIQNLASSADVFPYFTYLQPGTLYLLNLQPFVEADAAFDKGDFLPGLLAASPEPLWSLPIGVAYQLIYFDKAAFNEAGLSYPTIDWTTDEFLDAAQALTMREGDEVTRWGFVHNQLRFSPLVAALLDKPLAVGDDLRLTDPDVVDAVQWVSDLFTVHRVSPWLEAYRPYEQQTAVGQSSQFALMQPGSAAMWQRSHVVFDPADDQLGVTTIPRGPKGYAADPIQYGFAISRGTRHPEAAWQLLSFLTRQPPQETVASLLTPARRTVAASTGYWEEVPAALLPALQYAAENNATVRLPYGAANLLLEAIVQHLEGGLSVTEALGQQARIAASQPEETETEIVVIPETKTQETVEGVLITFVSLNSSPLLEAHRFLAAQFQREHPDITIRIEAVEDFELDRVVPADCFLTSASSLRNEQLRAAILPLGPLLELDGSLQPNDFYPLQWNTVIEEGELLGLPAFMRLALLHYNRQLFQAANVPEPRVDWTLADFLDLAQKLTQGVGETKQFGYAEPFVYFFSYGVTAFGIQAVNQSGETPRFDYGAMTEMVAWYVDLIRLHEIQPSQSGNPMADSSHFQELLRSGRAAMWPSSATELVVAMQNAPLDYEIGSIPLPLGPSGSRGVVEDQTYAYAIFTASPHREACWEWIKFLSLQPQAAPLGGGNVYFPAHIITAESSEYMDMVGADAAAIGRAAMSSSSISFQAGTPRWMGLPGFYWLRVAYLEAISGEGDVPTAMSNADEKFTRYGECVTLNDAFEDYAAWRECAIEVDPDLEKFLSEPDE